MAGTLECSTQTVQVPAKIVSVSLHTGMCYVRDTYYVYVDVTRETLGDYCTSFLWKPVTMTIVLLSCFYQL